jgi:hypothetical protein
MTLDEFLKAFTDEETESVSDAISVRVSDAVAQCLRRPPKSGRRIRRAARKKERGPSDPLLTDLSEALTNNDDDLIH